MTDHANPGAHADAAPHALPARVLLGTFAALVALTVATVITSRMDLGPMNLVVALGIASLKASLVAMFFMHLRYEHRFQAVIFVTALVFVVVFVGFVVFDTVAYQPDLKAALEVLQRQAAAQAQ